jgi:hypothetical protein
MKTMNLYTKQLFYYLVILNLSTSLDRDAGTYHVFEIIIILVF